MRGFVFLLCVLALSASGQTLPQAKVRTITGDPVTFSTLSLQLNDVSLTATADVFREMMTKLTRPDFFQEQGPVVTLSLQPGLPAQSYQIHVESGGISVQASDRTGLAFGVGTLIQLASTGPDGGLILQAQEIIDGPDLAYRSFMIDLGRNPHPPELLKQVIDALWLLRVNILHLHLTDDQLCSWPSRAFPKLTEKRAGWQWDDWVALEKYASARGVTLVPELDVPGHSTLLRKHYPEVFGKTPTELATQPEAFTGVTTLIDEMLSVFQSTPYFHMGGDEAYGVPHEVQRAFINKINEHVKSRHKQLIVWEGPPPGQGKNAVAQDVIHACWRCTEFPAAKMISAGHPVINASWDPLYIVDHYPRTMFTAVDLKRCYDFDVSRYAHINASFKTFSQPHQARADKHLGFCMPWWEGRAENLLPLCLPRIAAVSCATWNRVGESDFATFQPRYRHLLSVLKKISGMELPEIPLAEPQAQKDNLAYRAQVSVSAGGAQPHFSPARLTNGIPTQFDHFLGFPTTPKPLEINLTLQKSAEISRIVVYERAVGKSHEVYQVHVSSDGAHFKKVGESKKGTRGKKNHVEHRFQSQMVSHIKIVTSGCHGLTFPSFSRLSEVMAFAK